MDDKKTYWIPVIGMAHALYDRVWWMKYDSGALFIAYHLIISTFLFIASLFIFGT